MLFDLIDLSFFSPHNWMAFVRRNKRHVMLCYTEKILALTYTGWTKQWVCGRKTFFDQFAAPASSEPLPRNCRSCGDLNMVLVEMIKGENEEDELTYAEVTEINQTGTDCDEADYGQVSK